MLSNEEKGGFDMYGYFFALTKQLQELLSSAKSEEAPLQELIRLLYIDCQNPYHDPRSKFYHNEYHNYLELVNKMESLLEENEPALTCFRDLIDQRDLIVDLSELELFERAFEFGICFARGNLEEELFGRKTETPDIPSEKNI